MQKDENNKKLSIETEVRSKEISIQEARKKSEELFEKNIQEKKKLKEWIYCLSEVD